MTALDTHGVHGSPSSFEDIQAAMRPKLLTLDEVRDRLATTEPLAQHHFPISPGIKFRLDGAWNQNIDAVGPDEPVEAFITIGEHGQEYRLTHDALLEATSICGIPKGYASRTPANLIEPQLNYWFGSGLGGKEFKLLAVGDEGKAFTRGTINPFSNLRLLEEAVDGITQKFGDETEILADYKFQHTLRATNFRLIVPGQVREITDTGTDNDFWSTGITVRNSLIGETTTALEGYLFRWWCTNGAIDELASSGVWSRKSGGQGDDVYEWARTAVDEVLGGLEHSLEMVQGLTSIEMPGEVNDVLRDIFATYRIPGPQRQAVIEAMVEAEDLNMYSIMQAITQVANHGDLDPRHAEQMMRIGGALARNEHDRCVTCHRVTV